MSKKDIQEKAKQSEKSPPSSGWYRHSRAALFGATALMSVAMFDPAQAQAPSPQRPNIVVIMADDIGIWNIGAYHRGMMAGRTPNLDKIAAEGMLFTDYYAEASCTAGRANFITGAVTADTATAAASSERRRILTDVIDLAPSN